MPSLPGPLRSPKNLVALGLGFCIAVGFWLLSSSSRDSDKSRQPPLEQGSEPDELDHMERAVRMARAWRVTSSGSVGNQSYQTVEDVVCPSDSHTVTRSLAPEGPGEITEEFISAANTLYAREAGQSWHSEPDPSPDRCASGPAAGAQKLLTLIASMKYAVRVTAGPVIKLADGTCRILEFSGASNLPFHSICVEDTTNLPRRLQVGGLLVEYSQWNQPASIVPPEMPSPHPGR